MNTLFTFYFKLSKLTFSMCIILALNLRIASGEIIIWNIQSDKVEDTLNRTLYNGIRLPDIWPPESGDPASMEPMRVPYLENPPEIIPVDVGRQLFIDDFLIEKTNLIRVYHHARKYENNPVFSPTTEYELKENNGQTSVTYLGHGGVFFDPREELFKMFYTAGWRGGLAMAVSRNLISWERPDLNLAGGNIILPPGQLMAGGDNSVWMDQHSKDTTQRFKLLVSRSISGLHHGQRDNDPVHTLHFSKDGRIWSQGIYSGHAGDYCSFFHNPFRNLWVFSIKQNTIRGRARYYSESKDFIQGADWNNSVYWINADRLDEPDPVIMDAPQLYSLNAIAYESILLGEFYIHLGPNNQICNEGNFPKLTELKLGFSRDGFHWYRPDRRPFINATRKESDWDRAYIHGTTGVCLVMGNEIWFPYCGYSGIAPDGRRGMYTGASIGMATIRRDGFASMESKESKGFLITRPLIFNGKHFFVNVDCPDGELRVEILDVNNKVIAPFSAKNCVPVRVNKTIQPVRWKGFANISALKGKTIKFRFFLTEGRLYSFWISPDESGASYGYVGAGGPGYDGGVDNKGINAYINVKLK